MPKQTSDWKKELSIGLTIALMMAVLSTCYYKVGQDSRAYNLEKQKVELKLNEVKLALKKLE